MKSLVLLALSLSLMSCNKKMQYIEAEFQGDYDSFIAEASKHGRMIYNTDNLEIKRGSCEREARCDLEITAGFAKAIVIIRSDLKNISDEYRRALVFHELGHCLLYKRHNSESRGDGSPLSLMHPNLPGQIFLRNDWVYYVDELMSYSP